MNKKKGQKLHIYFFQKKGYTLLLAYINMQFLSFFTIIGAAKPTRFSRGTVKNLLYESYAAIGSVQRITVKTLGSLSIESFAP